MKRFTLRDTQRPRVPSTDPSDRSDAWHSGSLSDGVVGLCRHCSIASETSSGQTTVLGSILNAAQNLNNMPRRLTRSLLQVVVVAVISGLLGGAVLQAFLNVLMFSPCYDAGKQYVNQPGFDSNGRPVGTWDIPACHPRFRLVSLVEPRVQWPYVIDWLVHHSQWTCDVLLVLDRCPALDFECHRNKIAMAALPALFDGTGVFSERLTVIDSLSFNDTQHVHRFLASHSRGSQLFLTPDEYLFPSANPAAWTSEAAGGVFGPRVWIWGGSHGRVGLGFDRTIMSTDQHNSVVSKLRDSISSPTVPLVEVAELLVDAFKNISSSSAWPTQSPVVPDLARLFQPVEHLRSLTSLEFATEHEIRTVNLRESSMYLQAIHSGVPSTAACRPLNRTVEHLPVGFGLYVRAGRSDVEHQWQTLAIVARARGLTSVPRAELLSVLDASSPKTAYTPDIALQIPVLRRLAQLTPIGMQPEYYAFVANGTGHIGPRRLKTACTALGLLLELQGMCPESHPAVQVNTLGHVPNSWKAVGYETCGRPNNARDLLSQDGSPDIKPCQTYGEVHCCDYDPLLWPLAQARVHSKTRSLLKTLLEL
ncbi:MAG: uncharacterized protein KVP18_000700 [Porospora cf. gigantea A]|uniref:uncharacterized protein n=2 Tax=Porospora cf. gigantea A TaxID=2853593 RepID=UPI00355ABBF4|nr:MAG: hypothetical protein KVP18_000700 [Porospora cf. gigantea A]